MGNLIKSIRLFYQNNTSPQFRTKVSVVREKINRLLFDKQLIKRQFKKNQELAAKLRGKEKVRVVFLAQIPSIWKFDELYSLMEKDDHFEPMVLVCPLLQHGEDIQEYYMQLTYDELSKKGYKVYSAYKDKEKTLLNLQTELAPDIVFHTRPYKSLIPDEYYVTNLTEVLNCSVPYGMMLASDKVYFDSLFYNLLWLYFADTVVCKQTMDDIQYLKGRNVFMTGYSGCDQLFSKTYKPTDPWKIQDRKLKRIIWAPHHTIEHGHSNFKIYYQYFLDLSKKYSDRLQLAFKPHPLLKEHLYRDKDWGKERTDAYYAGWDQQENTQLVEGNYIDWFITSDAMIHDSESFVGEYLYTLKPCMYCFDERESIVSLCNEFGVKALRQYYKSYSPSDIEMFLEKVVFGGEDTMYESRKKFFDEYLCPPFTGNASLNILNKIKEFL